VARRKSRKESDYLAYPHTPEKQLEHPSGWCMTEHHEGCKHQFNHGKCGCICHSKPIPAKRGRPKKIAENEIDIEIKGEVAEPADPRPWRK